MNNGHILVSIILFESSEYQISLQIWVDPGNVQ